MREKTCNYKNYPTFTVANWLSCNRGFDELMGNMAHKFIKQMKKDDLYKSGVSPAEVVLTRYIADFIENWVDNRIPDGDSLLINIATAGQALIDWNEVAGDWLEMVMERI